MSFAARVEPASKDTKKPLILCDVGGTLLLDENGEYSVNPNQKLITLLNRAVEQGFEVRLCTGGIDSGTWPHDREKLEKTNIDPAILKNVSGKRNIRSDTYSGVVAIIDDDTDPYIRAVIGANLDAKHFGPLQCDELSRHLQVAKAKGVRLGE